MVMQIKKLMKRAGITQEIMARQCGVSQGRISYWLKWEDKNGLELIMGVLSRVWGFNLD